MSKPLVSIVMPTCNREDRIRFAVLSVYEQTYTNWELIIVDNGTNDNTKNLLREFTDNDKRIRYFQVEKSKNPGISEYLNYGISLSTGKYIARLDDDDVWFYKEKLAEQVDFLEANQDYVLVGGGVIMVDAENKEINRYCKKETDAAIRKYALLACPFDHPAIMFRKDTSDKIGGYGNYKVSEDLEFFLRMGKEGKVFNIQKYYINYMQAGKGMLFHNETEVALMELKVITKYRHDYPNYYLGIFITTLQLIYTFLPGFIRRKFHYSVRFIKRKYL